MNVLIRMLIFYLLIIGLEKECCNTDAFLHYSHNIYYANFIEQITKKRVENFPKYIRWYQDGTTMADFANPRICLLLIYAPLNYHTNNYFQLKPFSYHIIWSNTQIYISYPLSIFALLSTWLSIHLDSQVHCGHFYFYPQDLCKYYCFIFLTFHWLDCQTCFHWCT